MAENKIGRNITFPIYNADGTSFHNLVLHKSVVDSVVMSLSDNITGDVYYKDNALAVSMHEYVIFKKNPEDASEDGVKYLLVNPPTIVREGVVSNNSDLNGMTKYSFTFYHPMYILNNLPFSDVAVSYDEERYLSQNKTFAWIGKPNDFIAKLNKNLENTQWVVVKSDRFPVEKDDVLSGILTFENNTIADALKTGYETWEIPYVVDVVKSGETHYSQGKRFKVVFGLPSNEIYATDSDRQQNNPYVFRMGKGLGLKNNSRTPRNNKIITRISGYGSENNIPYGYPQIIWTGDQSWDYTINNASGMQTITVGGRTIQAMSYPIYDGIVGGQKVRLIKHPFTRSHLMPTIYTQTVDKKVNPRNPNYNPNGEIIDYYDAISSQDYQYPNEIDPTAPSYQIHEFDVKPEMSVGGQDVAITGAVPLNSDLTPADSWDDTMDDDGNYVQSYFRLDLPILSFDIYACASITEEMSINMRSGACIGCTFNVQVDWEDYKRNFYHEDGTFDPVIHTEEGDGHVRDGSRYPDSSQNAISLIVQKDMETFGTLMPNVYQNPHNGDYFVVLGISLPAEYISDAEEYLDEEMKSYMLENNVYYYDYPLKFDEFFLSQYTNILQQVKPNTIIHFAFGCLQEPLQLYVKQLTIKYGNSPLPQYDITLTDNIEVVLNQIGQVADDVEKLSSLLSIMREGYSRNVWNEIAKKLSKVSDDTAKGKITFEKGAEFGTYNTGALGSGGAINIDQNGNSNAEFDFLTIRKAASFRTISILELKHVGGEMGLTAGAMKVSAVEELPNAYRCYFDTSDGTKQVYQEFVVGDQARCQQFWLAQDSSGMLTTKYYWRLVTGVGENYVDLSKTDADTGSGVPQAGDEVIQLGYRDEITVDGETVTLPDHPERQSAIILSAVESQAPSIRYYQGINSYNLSNTIVKEDYYDPTTSLFHTNTYGESYVGAKDQTTYMKYTQSGGVEIKGVITAASGSVLDGGTVNNTNINQVINTLTQNTTAAQNTATQAATDADTALTAAQNAQGTANSASSEAQSASQAAQQASEDASTANGNATQALNIANNLSTGNGNLLRNSGFTGDYLDENVAPLSNVSSGTEMYSDPLDHWTATNVSIITSAESASGKAAVLSDGSLEQNLEIGVEQGKPYVFSFKGKGTSVHFYVGAYETTVTLSGSTERYNVKFTAPSSSQAFAITGSTCTIMELQLIEGNIPFNNWVNHPKDNDKSLAYFQNYSYLLDAIINGNTKILGGLILSQMIKVGNYRNQQLTEETGGMSGFYNSGDSPFLWGGGTMQQAFYTIAKYADNPNYEPSASELANLMANFVVTHGGRAILNDVILRGYVYALGGVFRGNVYANGGIFNNIDSPNGNFKIDAAGNMVVNNATISGNMYAPLFVINNANYEQCTRASSAPYDSYRYINLDVTGLNIQIDAEVFRTTLGISLPNDEKYNGAIVRISNNTKNRIPLYNSVVKANRATGTLRTSNNESFPTNIEPSTYVMMQCECFSAKTVCMGYSYLEFTKGSQMQKIADVQVGDELRIVGGIVFGDDGYKVYGGTSASSASIRIWDTTSSQDIDYRVSGFETTYSVKSSPACTAIYGNLDYDDTRAAVYVYKLNTQAFYGWKNTNEHSYEGKYDNPQNVRFYTNNHGASVGSNPYIDENGILRFENWTRQATNGTVYQNE